eukprot:m.192722 g.192722  ORF g.192722 m.192722 type:complete len:315 (+) comp18273_c1_seq1:381-1325(+)
MTTPLRHFLRVTDVSGTHLRGLVAAARRLKQVPREEQRQLLSGYSMAMLFAKPSLRTHTSFEIGMWQLGGHATYLSDQSIGLGEREPVRDVSRVVSRMADIVIARVHAHATVRDLAAHSTVPVINALCDLEHPCQAVADFVTISEHKGEALDGSLSMAFVGDANNNIAHSLALGCALLGIHFRIAAPEPFWMDRAVAAEAQALAQASGSTVLETSSAAEAVDGVDVVYTDTWVSMGDEAQKEERVRQFAGMQVTPELMQLAKPDAIFMHDMPAYRGLEVHEDVIDGPQSIIIDQAENRLHGQKAIICDLAGVKI